MIMKNQPSAQCAADVPRLAGQGAVAWKEANMNKQKITILYSRLSVDDDRDGESGSIQNQKMRPVQLDYLCTNTSCRTEA